MYVVGTSGHIDHGKTSLILALTGTDCDRLPEEKARQMTIDIGFAGMEVPGFGTVNFIDVPGHERFIRNMVAGAWGIDLGLLVVAADDGWMPQTEDHFRVLQLLGVERIIAAINKIDAADSETTDLVEEQVRERIAGTRYEGAQIARVSAKTGDGIDALRDAIAANLKKLSRATDADKPYLYIDRVFASKGYGTVVTGTLRNGILHENDAVTIQPGNIEGRIKRIESNYSAIEEGSPSQRTALNISGVPADTLKRGHILYRQRFFTESEQIIARLELLETKRELKNNAGIEVLIGTAAVKGKVILLSGDKITQGAVAARIKFNEPWYTYPGQPFVLTGPGGFRILGGGRVLLPAYDSHKNRGQVVEGLGLFRSYGLEERIAFIISVRRGIKRTDLHAMFPERTEDIESALISLVKKNLVKQTGDYLMPAKYYDSLVKRILETVNKHIGLNLKEIADITGDDQDICRLIMPSLVSAKQVMEKEGKFFSDRGGQVGLSKGKKQLMDTAKANGGGGIELDNLGNESVRTDAKELIKLGELVSLDGNILYHREVYEKMRDAIMAQFVKKDKLSVPEAKEVVGLSRKYIIPLLNRIERDGMIRRLGDFRVKV